MIAFSRKVFFHRGSFARSHIKEDKNPAMIIRKRNEGRSRMVAFFKPINSVGRNSMVDSQYKMFGFVTGAIKLSAQYYNIFILTSP